jgi:hypothetical protein
MKLGKYTVDQIENDNVTLLWREDENVREIRNASDFPFEVNEGDIVKVKKVEDKEIFLLLEEETTLAKQEAEELLRKIINKNK